MRCPNARQIRPELGLDCVDPEYCQQGGPCVNARRVINKTKEHSVTQEQHDSVRAAIEDWWREQAEREIDAVIPKAVEYGATDLAELGRTMGQIMNREGLSHEQATELGIYFYMVGKFARWMDAIKDGRQVSMDTLYDIKVYTTMAMRNREVGGWPFPPEDRKANETIFDRREDER